MTHFINVGSAVQQGVVGDTIEGRRIHWSYGEGDYELVWIARSRQTALVRSLVNNCFKFVQADGLVVMDSYIGPEWTTERVLQAAGAEMAIAEGAAKADQYESHR